MHEMGITQGILATSFEVAENAGAERITEIRISVGELTEIMEFALQFAFESLTPGTMAEGATLVVTHLPAKSRCGECGHEYEHDRFTMLCPECDSMLVTLLQGRELTIDSIETDRDGVDGEPAAPAEEKSDKTEPSGSDGESARPEPGPHTSHEE
jgi:hydrogenase nickel incorporation protein HypA/HybF